ncbi:MAG: peptide chain release factor N(5)-glutamine methyltransferase [Bryobacterales bacterium]
MGPPISISKALQQAVATLQQAHVGEPRLTAEVLLCAALGRDKAFLYAHAGDDLDPGQAARFQADMESRCSGVPTQYITGSQEFYGLPFRVTPDVLIPRPETELLVEQALARASAGDCILDIGTGSGAVALAILGHLPGARVFACDVSRAALSVAGDNARSLSLDLPLVQADLSEAFKKGVLDMIVCNPPYISSMDMSSLQKEVRDYEPHLALFGGEDGLDAYRRLSATVCDLLRPSGWLLLEVGYNTSAAVKPMFDGAAWEKPSVYRDLAGWERVLAVQRGAARTKPEA